jgi:hypothetical protein
MYDRNDGCSLYRMAHENPTQTILRSAVDVVGGPERLADALHVRREELDAWIAGRAEPPPGALMDAVDLATLKAQLKDVS